MPVQTDPKFMQDLYGSLHKCQLILKLSSDMKRGMPTESLYFTNNLGRERGQKRKEKALCCDNIDS